MSKAAAASYWFFLFTRVELKPTYYTHWPSTSVDGGRVAARRVIGLSLCPTQWDSVTHTQLYVHTHMHVCVVGACVLNTCLWHIATSCSVYRYTTSEQDGWRQEKVRLNQNSSTWGETRLLQSSLRHSQDFDLTCSTRKDHSVPFVNSLRFVDPKAKYLLISPLFHPGYSSSPDNSAGFDWQIAVPASVLLLFYFLSLKAFLYQTKTGKTPLTLNTAGVCFTY